LHVPTADVWLRADDRFSLGFWHWGFLAQAAPFPEPVIQAVGGADFFFRNPDRAKDLFGSEALEDYRNCLADPETVRSICDDYRAGAGIDREIDMGDRNIKKIRCPVQVLWGEKSSVGLWYDAPTVWKIWADDLITQPLQCAHFVVDEQPDQVLTAFRDFFRG
jgi:haloacetate dehalogenase